MKTRKRTWSQKEKTKIKTSVRRVQESLGKATGFVLIVWLAWFANFIFFPVDFNDFGLISRNIPGLVGIITMPFLHGDFWHIFNNTIGLWVLLSALFLSHKLARAEVVLLQLIVVTGIVLWLFGMPSSQPYVLRVHIGASGLVYALAVYAMITGFKHKNYGLMVLSVIVMAQCGAGLVSGLFPIQQGVSWDGHLAGAISGAMVAFKTEKKNLRTNLRQR